MSVGARLKEIRKISKLNQQNFAEKLKVTDKTYWNYEKDVSDISVSCLTNLFTLFNVNLNWLITGEGEMFLSDKNDDFDKKVESKINEVLSKHKLIEK